MPFNTTLKYEIKEKDGIKKVTLDRLIGIPVPRNYGYFPGTLSLDSDPLDVFILGTNEPIAPGTELEGKIIGGLNCVDNGESDDKLFIILGNGLDTTLGYYVKIVEYLRSYKAGFEVLSSYSEEEAIEVYNQSVVRYRKQQIGRTF